MHILIAPDKFKGSLSAHEVGTALANSLQQATSDLKITIQPLADGGDGSLAILAKPLALKQQTVQTCDSLGRPLTTTYFTSSEAAFIELASASGLVLLKAAERNPLQTSTLGTGKIIVDAISKGFHQIYLFLGGSATNDAGLGIASALGFEILDATGRQLAPIGKNLAAARTLRDTHIFDFSKLKLTLLCDVNNPLYGPKGAAYVYAAQKGATDEQVEFLDRGLQNIGLLLEAQTNLKITDLPGVGAAGGIGAGLVALCGAKLVSGFETIAKLTNLESQIQAADWVLSGEGKLDSQSLHGKVVSGVAGLCQKYRKPLILFVGRNELSDEDLDSLKIERVFSLFEKAEDTEDAMQQGHFYLEQLGSEFCEKIGLN